MTAGSVFRGVLCGGDLDIRDSLVFGIGTRGLLLVSFFNPVCAAGGDRHVELSGFPLVIRSLVLSCLLVHLRSGAGV